MKNFNLIMLLTLIILASQIVSAATVAYWRFEDGTNDVENAAYLDYSGYGNIMTSNGSIGTNDIPFPIVPQTTHTNTLASGFVAIDAHNGDYLSTTGDKFIDIYDFNNAGWTIEAIVKFHSLSNDIPTGRPGIICKEGELGEHRYPYFNLQLVPPAGADPAYLRVVTARDDGANRIFSAAAGARTPIVTGKWYAIAVTYTRDAPDDPTRSANLYIKEESDTEYEFEATSSGPWSGIDLNGDLPWTIGRGFRDNGGKGYVSGIIDEVRISDVPLTSTYFLASVTTGPEPPVFFGISNSPLEPTDTDMVEISTRVTTVNSTITNVTYEYSVNGGGYMGPFQMAPIWSLNGYAATIISQTVDSIVSFRMTAVNSAGESTTTDDFVYSVYENIPWESVVATSDSIAGGWNISGMAVAPNGLAGFAYQSAANNKAHYIEESALGIMKPAVEITTNSQGFNSGIVFGTNGEPRVTLSYDAVINPGGLTYVQRTNGAWTSPMRIVTNNYEEYRSVIAIGPNQIPSVLWYKNDGDAGKLVDITTVDSFSTIEITSPPFPINVASKSTDECRRPFGMLFGTDSQRRIALSGRSEAEELWFGIEDSIGSESFDWERLFASNVYAEQMGFALDANDKAYIACRDEGTTPSTAVLFENSSGAWVKHILGPMGHWGHCAVAVNPDNGSVWVAHNAVITDYHDGFKLWSNRADPNVWKKEQSITNGIIVDSIAGFGITELGTMKIAFKPNVNSTDLVYMYSTKFTIPEPGTGIWIVGLLELWIVVKRRTSNVE